MALKAIGMYRQTTPLIFVKLEMIEEWLSGQVFCFLFLNLRTLLYQLHEEFGYRVGVWFTERSSRLLLLSFPSTIQGVALLRCMRIIRKQPVRLGILEIKKKKEA